MQKKFLNIFKGDKVIWAIFFILCLVSIIEVFSASSFLTYKTGNFLGPLIKHTAFIIGGVCAAVIVLNVPCKYFKILTAPMLLISFIMLVSVLIIGHATNDAARWVDLGFIQFQPSEIAKGTLVLAVAQILSGMQTEDGADKQAFWWVMGISSLIILPIFVENFSTAAIIFAVVFLMMFIARVPLSMLGKLIGGLLLVAIIAIGAVMAIGQDNVNTAAPGSEEKTALVENADGSKEPSKDHRQGILHRFDTWKSRIMKFTKGGEVDPKDYDLDKDAQVAHANIAIVKSNFIGRGPGNSEERDFLSQAFSDFIFAIIIEETGLWGAAFVAGLYVIIFFRVGRIARNCANTFPAYLAMGIALLLVVQAMFNMMVAVGLAPVTGQPLPLISKGGTSTIINCVYIGVLLSISKSAKKRDTATQPTQKPTLTLQKGGNFNMTLR